MRVATVPRSPATVVTVAAFVRVAAVAWPTRSTSTAVSVVRRAAVSTLRAISWVAAPCWVTAAAMVLEIAPMSRIVRSIAPIAWIARVVAFCMPPILRRDVIGRLGGLARQRLDLARHDRKATAGLASTGRLDGGVERQEIGLLGNVGDQAHHVADAAGRLVELLDGRIGVL